MTEPARQRERRNHIGVMAIRYAIPVALILAGQVVLVAGGDGANLEGWAMFTGAGLSVLMLNVLHRAGVSGDRERDREDAARAYFDAHGRWPDEPTAGRDDQPTAQPPPGRLTPKVAPKLPDRHPSRVGRTPGSMRPGSRPTRRRGAGH